MNNPFETGPSEIQQVPTDIPDIPNVFTVDSGAPHENFTPSIEQNPEPQAPMMVGGSSPFTPMQEPINTPPPVSSPFEEPQPVQQPNTFFDSIPSFGNSMPEKKKFNITDLYWFKNLKPKYNQPLEQHETTGLVMSYNADFENLRISFVNFEEKDQRAFMVPAGARINSMNVFSETCRELLSYVNDMGGNVQYPIVIINQERLITSSSNGWEPNLSELRLVNNQILKISTIQPNQTKHVFTLVGWQTKAFLEVCQFMTNGQSWNLRMQALTSR